MTLCYIYLCYISIRSNTIEFCCLKIVAPAMAGVVGALPPAMHSQCQTKHYSLWPPWQFCGFRECWIPICEPWKFLGSASVSDICWRRSVKRPPSLCSTKHNIYFCQYPESGNPGTWSSCLWQNFTQCTESKMLYIDCRSGYWLFEQRTALYRSQVCGWRELQYQWRPCYFLECDGGITGQVLAEMMLEVLRKPRVDPMKLWGQAYDGASNMSGKTNGAAAPISAQFPLALYIHCSSHCLNLAVVSSLEVTSVHNMIGVLNRVSLFFSAHPKRQTKLEDLTDETQPESHVHKVKDLCRTRWIERIDALDRFQKLHSSSSLYGKHTGRRKKWMVSGLTHGCKHFPTGDHYHRFC